MAVVISDEVLRAAGMSEREALTEVACRFFEAEKLALRAAAEMAHLTRVQFEQELLRRKIPIYRPSAKDLRADMATLDRLGV